MGEGTPVKEFIAIVFLFVVLVCGKNKTCFVNKFNDYIQQLNESVSIQSEGESSLYT